MSEGAKVMLERKLVDVAIEGVEDDGTFEGYASLFDRVDMSRDIVERGAFSSAIARRGAGGIRMLFQHDPAQPIGAWTSIAEDEYGLKVRGRLSPGSEKAREVRALIRDGALDGLSIGFKVVRGRTDPKTGIRHIRQADLWEISVVTFPMQEGARISLKGNGLPTTRQFERWLTRDAQLTRKEARHVVAHGFASLRRERDAAPEGTAALAEAIRRAAHQINERTILR
ncbi:HK97 family phage prohead protease [Aliihoeflea sp. PC F10.4]